MRAHFCARHFHRGANIKLVQHLGKSALEIHGARLASRHSCPCPTEAQHDRTDFGLSAAPPEPYAAAAPHGGGAGQEADPQSSGSLWAEPSHDN